MSQTQVKLTPCKFDKWVLSPPTNKNSWCQPSAQTGCSFYCSPHGRACPTRGCFRPFQDHEAPPLPSTTLPGSQDLTQTLQSTYHNNWILLLPSCQTKHYPILPRPPTHLIRSLHLLLKPPYARAGPWIYLFIQDTFPTTTTMDHDMWPKVRVYRQTDNKNEFLKCFVPYCQLKWTVNLI